LQDPDGYTKTLHTWEIGDLSTKKIDTSGFTKTGTYKIWLKTKKEEACGLEIESSTKEELKVFRPEIEIEAETTAPPTHKDVLFTVTAPPYTEFNFTTNNEEYVIIDPELEDMGTALVIDKSKLPDGTKGNNSFRAKTDENGEFKFVARFMEDKSFKFEVSATIMGVDKKDDRCEQGSGDI